MSHVTVIHIISHYGYIGLFLSLVLGIIGLPVPDETLLTFAGFLVSAGKLHFLLTISVAFLGSICGMTISFFIGHYLGLPFLDKYGKKIHLPPERLKKVENWFNKFGRFTVTFGYFIPGFRHFTAYSAGISRWSYSTFVIYAIPGGLIWSFTFISLGAFLQEHWFFVSIAIHRYFREGLVILIIIGVISWIIFTMLGKKANKITD